MGGARWLQFKSPQERERAERFLAPTLMNPTIEIPFRTGTRTVGCGIEQHGAKTLSIEYSAYWLDTITCDLICREISRRFDVRRIGADSVGWYPDKEWAAEGPRSARERYGPYTTWATWMKEFKITWSCGVSKDDLPDVQPIEEQVVALFQRLDKEASCLTSTP